MPEGFTSISRHTPATLRVQSGQTLEVQVDDWCFGRINSDPKTYPEMQKPRCPIAGPIDVAGADVGDSLSIRVEKIALDERGTAGRFRNVGPLPSEGETRIWDVQRSGDHVEFAGVRLITNPMIGIIGTRPDSDGPIGTRYTGTYGGNLDTREITVGTQVELPVFTAGGGVFVGDLHAAMGDGELTASGCEFGGTVGMQITLLKGETIPGPRLRLANRWLTLATSKDFQQACREACDAMHQWIMRERGLSNDAAAFVISMTGGVGISQVVNPSGVTVKVMVDWRRVVLPSDEEKRR